MAISTKNNIAVKKLLAGLILMVAVVATYATEYSADNMISTRKLKMTDEIMRMPPQNCGVAGDYCDLANWCCGWQLTCKRNPGFDFSGTCQDLPGCLPKGSFCSTKTPFCCYGYSCSNLRSGYCVSDLRVQGSGK